MLLAPARADLLELPRPAGEDLAAARWSAPVGRTCVKGYVGVAGRLVGIDSPRVNIRRRKHWGWGFEDQQPSAAELRAAAALAQRTPRVCAPLSVEARWALERRASCAAARDLRAGTLARDLREPIRTRAPRHALGQVLLRRGPRLSRALRASPGLRRLPARGGRRRAGARVVLGGARRRDPLRRRHVASWAA